MNQIKKIENLIVDNRLDEALAALRNLFEQHEDWKSVDEVLLQTSRLNFYQERFNQGIIESFDTEYGKTRLAVLDLKRQAFQLLKSRQAPPQIPVQPTIPQPDQMHVIFLEEFDQNNRKWPEGERLDGGKPGANFLIHHGRYIFEHFRESGSWYVTYEIEMDPSKPFKIETIISFLEGADHGYGLTWGRLDNNNHFFFEVSPNGYFRAGQYLAGSYLPFCEWTLSPTINLGKSTNKLHVEKNGDQVFYFVNNQKVFQTDFLSFFGHNLGFQLNWKMKVAIDYLKVWN